MESTSDQDKRRLNELVRENQAIIKGFAGKGVRLDQNYRLSFFIRLPQRNFALECRAGARKKGYFSYVRNIVDSRSFHCVFEVVLPLDARRISEVELEQLDLCHRYGGQSDGWEFPEQA